MVTITTPEPDRPGASSTAARPPGETWVDRVRTHLAALDGLAGDDEFAAHLERLRQEGVDGSHRITDLGAGSRPSST